MEAENQQNEAIENAPENTLQVEEITDSEENTQDTLDLIKEEIVIGVDHKATRLDKNNLKKLNIVISLKPLLSLQDNYFFRLLSYKLY